MELVDFNYVFCPVLDREIRLKYSYERHAGGKEGRKTLIDCVGAMTCGTSRVENGEVVHDFSRCPFDKVGLIK